MNWQTKIIDVTLGELIDRDLEEFLDLLADRAFGTILAEEIEYRVVGIAGDHTLKLEVTANIPDDEERI